MYTLTPGRTVVAFGMDYDTAYGMWQRLNEDAGQIIYFFYQSPK